MLKKTKLTKKVKSKSTKKNKKTNPWFAFIKKIQKEKGIKKWGDAIKEAVKEKPRYFKEKKNGTQSGGDGMTEEDAENIEKENKKVINETERKNMEGGDDEEDYIYNEKGEGEGEDNSEQNAGKRRRKRSSKKRKSSKTKKQRKGRR
jgi:hypothetical protein